MLVECATQSLEDKVASIDQIQNDNGYMAVWEQDEQGNYIINEFNCPIAQVANKYNHACQSELALFGELLGCSRRTSGVPS